MAENTERGKIMTIKFQKEQIDKSYDTPEMDISTYHIVRDVGRVLGCAFYRPIERAWKLQITFKNRDYCVTRDEFEELKDVAERIVNR